MNYNELLNRLSNTLTTTKKKSDVQRKEIDSTNRSISKMDTTSTLLNQIGLEVQRQGG